MRDHEPPLALFAPPGDPDHWARALLDGRDYATPHDIKRVAPDVLRHRVIVTYEAEAQKKTSEDILKRIFNTVYVP